MADLPFSYTIGLEIHCELDTASKMFCRCANAPFGAQPNEHTCPVCLGLPGTLPVPNKEAVRKTVLVGKALGSEINRFSKWDRKHYFYPDLPKGYQISQYDLPFCVGGELALLNEKGEASSVVRFERVHLEEDAGKLMHAAGGYTRVDLNRAGVPLIEMVSKPDMHSPEQARAFMQEVQLMVRTLGVSQADMEKGQMRCDVNVSIQFEFEGKEISTPVTEIKNVNSTRAVERSLIVEGQRLFDEWQAGGPVRTRKFKLTAGWDEEKGTVRVNRTKEAANEYRYFPEPDIPPVRVYDIAELNPDNMQIPELPNARRLRYLQEGIGMSEIDIFLSDPIRLQRLEEYVAKGMPFKQVANWLINASDTLELAPTAFQELLELVAAGSAPFAGVKQKLPELLSELSTVSSVKEALKKLGLLQEHDDSVVQLAITETLAANPQAVQQFKDGKEQIIGFLVGQVMKKAAGKANPGKVQEAMRAALKAA
jgi:aspartyl-tRNA(Asn)/glutamyl-tRNA(Gln) amidotransferase subunit B